MAIAPDVLIHQIPEEHSESQENEKYFEMNSKTDEIEIVDEFSDVTVGKNSLSKTFSSQSSICSDEQRLWQINHIGW